MRWPFVCLVALSHHAHTHTRTRTRSLARRRCCCCRSSSFVTHTHTRQMRSDQTNADDIDRWVLLSLLRTIHSRIDACDWFSLGARQISTRFRCLPQQSQYVNAQTHVRMRKWSHTLTAAHTTPKRKIQKWFDLLLLLCDGDKCKNAVCNLSYRFFASFFFKTLCLFRLCRFCLHFFCVNVCVVQRGYLSAFAVWNLSKLVVFLSRFVHSLVTCCWIPFGLLLAL